MREKLTQIVTFTSERNDWGQLSRKFLAVAEKREYWKILETNHDKFNINEEYELHII